MKAISLEARTMSHGFSKCNMVSCNMVSGFQQETAQQENKKEVHIIFMTDPQKSHIVTCSMLCCLRQLQKVAQVQGEEM